jgi:sulfur carrier protein
MKVSINGDWREIAAATLAAALRELGYRHGAFATAVNGRVVPARVREQTLLAEGDRIEVLSPMQGG